MPRLTCIYIPEKKKKNYSVNLQSHIKFCYIEVDGQSYKKWILSFTIYTYLIFKEFSLLDHVPNISKSKIFQKNHKMEAKPWK